MEGEERETEKEIDKKGETEIRVHTPVDYCRGLTPNIHYNTCTCML